MSITVKVPEEVHEALREWAEEEERSLHGQVVYLLRRVTEEYRRQQQHGGREAPPSLLPARAGQEQEPGEGGDARA